MLYPRLFKSKIAGGAIPKEYIPGIEKGAKDALSSGTLAGYPVLGVKITLIDGSFHPVDSSEMAFEQAAAIAVRQGLEKAEPILLEPIMRLQLVVPEANYGAIQGNLIAKRGVITDTSQHSGMRVIDGMIPLAETFGYSSEVRGLTAGRGSFSMEPAAYEKVPKQVCDKILLTFS